MRDVVQGRWSARRLVVVLVLVLAAVLTASVTPVQWAEAQQQAAGAAQVWSPGGQCFRSREPTEEEVADDGVPAGTTGAHSAVLWAGPDALPGYYYPGCVPPGYEWNGVWWDQAGSPYEMVDCTDDLGSGCFWYVTGTQTFRWSKKAFVAFAGSGGGGAGGGGGSSPPAPDGSVDCGAGVVLLGAEIDAAVATIRGTGSFTEAGLGEMRADPCRYFPTSCPNLASYTAHLTDEARRSFRDQLSGPVGLWALADRILDDPCPHLTQEWVVAGADLALIPTLPGVGAPPVAPVRILPPLPFTLPGGGDPAAQPCRYMTDATPGEPVPAAAVAAAGKGADATPLAAGSPDDRPNPFARWYEAVRRFALPDSRAAVQSGVAVTLNGLASPVRDAEGLFESVLFDSHLSVSVFPGYNPRTCQEAVAPRVERIDIREVYEIVGTDRTRLREIERNSSCTGTSLCRRTWEAIPFSDAAAVGGGITSVRHFVFVTVKLEGRDEIELPSVAPERVRF